MICTRCLRSIFSIPTSTSTRIIPSHLRRTAQLRQSARSLTFLTRPNSRPTLSQLPPTGSTQPLIPATPSSSFQLQQQPSIGQVRGAIRDTFSPSHRVRKRRHGFLSRVRSRTGRKIIARRTRKGRKTMSH